MTRISILVLFPLALALLPLLRVGAQPVYWQPADGLYGGDIASLAADIHGHLFALVSRGKLYRSTNGGAFWSLTTLPEGQRSTVIIDSLLGVFVLGSDTVFRSTDEGGSWTLAGKAPTSLACIASTQTGSILVGRGGSGGVYRWRPQDTSWSPSGLAGEYVRKLVRNPWFGMIAATTKRIFHSTNGAATWDTLATTVPSTYYSCWADSDGTLFAGQQMSGLKYSTDRGRTWTASGLKGPFDVSVFACSRPREMYAGISPLDFSILGGIQKTTDGGVTWKSLGLTEWGIRALLVTGPGKLFAGTWRGVFASTDDGTTWMQSSDGIRAVQVSALLVADSTRLFLGGSGALFRSTNRGDEWTETGTGITCPIVTSLASDRAGNLFAGTTLFSPFGGVHKSTDGGQTWRCTSKDSIRGMYMTVKPLAVTPSGYVLAAAENKTFQSTDHGESWRTVWSLKGGTWTTAFALDPAGQVFAVTNGAGALRSTDEGASWMFTSPQLPSLVLRCAIARAPGELFVGGERGVSHTTNSGDTWTDISAPIMQPSISALAFDGSNGLLASTVTGKVYRTTNDGVSWMDVTSGLPGFQVAAFAVASPTVIFAATDTAGLYRANVLTLSIEPPSSPEPVQFMLCQNYPNPFNPSTIIKYELPTSSMVRLSVYDILGREVSVLANERKEAGVHHVQFSAAGLSSGVYFYRMQAGEFTQTRKLLLTK